MKCGLPGGYKMSTNYWIEDEFFPSEISSERYPWATYWITSQDPNTGKREHRPENKRVPDVSYVVQSGHLAGVLFMD